MTFLDVLNTLDYTEVALIKKNATKDDVLGVLNKNRLSFRDYLTLLSDQAATMLEDLAKKSQALTLKHFGRTILLYVPLYLSNECDNNCVYCGFSQRIPEKRVTLSFDEVMADAEILYQKGFRHLLLVSGEKRDKVTLDYLKKVVSVLHKKFQSVALEIFPLNEDEYAELLRAGADCVTLYQEVYDRPVFKKVHLKGAKANYENRLAAPERVARAGYYKLNIGTLLGLNEWINEAAAVGLHANYLKKNYWKTQIAVSFPRLKSSVARFNPPHAVSDKELVQMLCALRIFIPTLGLVLSTRESAKLRDNLIPLGITQLSAESKTNPGGYRARVGSEEQFEVVDKRSLAQVAAKLKTSGYEPVYKDWDHTFIH